MKIRQAEAMLGEEAGADVSREGVEMVEVHLATAFNWIVKERRNLGSADIALMQEKRRSETGEVKTGPGNRARFFCREAWRLELRPGLRGASPPAGTDPAQGCLPSAPWKRVGAAFRAPAEGPRRSFLVKPCQSLKAPPRRSS